MQHAQRPKVRCLLLSHRTNETARYQPDNQTSTTTKPTRKPNEHKHKQNNEQQLKKTKQKEQWDEPVCVCVRVYVRVCAGVYNLKTLWSCWFVLSRTSVVSYASLLRILCCHCHLNVFANAVKQLNRRCGRLRTLPDTWRCFLDTV
jgi:hypothetical protein